MATSSTAKSFGTTAKQSSLIWALKKYKYLYLMLIPGIVLTILFRYIPMYGIVMSFENFKIAKGIMGSEWVWFANFKEFFNDPYSGTLIKNTVLLGVFTLIFGFPIPIILAFSVNEILRSRLRQFIQTALFLPHFVSMVIIIGIIREILTLDTGIVNTIIANFGGNQIDFFAESIWFRPIYIFSGIWQDAGFVSIIYLAAIAGINPELYEAALMDGSNRFKNLIYITIPCIMPTITIMFILAIGGILGNDFTKILLIYSGSTFETADVLQTYIYRVGIEGGRYSYSSAIGVLNATVSFLFLYFANLAARKVGGNSIW